MIKQKHNNRWMEVLLTICFIFYIWYLGSTLLLPLSEFLPLPNFIYVTLYKLVEFPPSILGFVFCVSLISTIVIISEFEREKTWTKIFLIQGLTFMLYFVIPILATIFLLVLVLLQISGQIPTEARISYFLEDLFLFTSALFLLTAILNLVMHKLIEAATRSEEEKEKKPSPQKHPNEYYKRPVDHK